MGKEREEPEKGGEIVTSVTSPRIQKTRNAHTKKLIPSRSRSFKEYEFRAFEASLRGRARAFPREFRFWFPSFSSLSVL